jgi:hypothetical protein
LHLAGRSAPKEKIRARILDREAWQRFFGAALRVCAPPAQRLRNCGRTVL